MDVACLDHLLTDDQRKFFNEMGYLIVEDALDTALLERLTEIVDRVDQRERTPELRSKLMSVTNIICEDPALTELCRHRTTFPKVWGILGWNIYLYHSHLDVTPPADEAALTWRVAWHQDSMRVNDEIETSPRPRLSLKVGFYLTDVSEPDRGNTLVVPGSQLQDEPDCPADGISNPDGAIPVCVRAGSAVLLDRRVWHSRSANTSPFTRKVIWLGYSYRWLKPKDEMTVSHLYPQLNPIERQLLGDGLSANGAYDPQDGDVPLKCWLQEHCPAEAERTLRGRPQSRPPAMVRGKNAGRQ